MSTSVSMTLKTGITYPRAVPYSPHVAYPEYRFSSLSDENNLIYDHIRQTFMDAGLDLQNAETKNWNPLGEFIPPESRVFVLCNFVYHKRFGESETDFFSKCSHPSVIRAVVDYIHIAVGESGSVTIGNSPLQSCDWQKVVDNANLLSVLKFYKDNGITSVDIQDIRLYVGKRTFAGAISKEEVHASEDAVFIDLREKSLLEPLGEQAFSKFRVSDYDPETMKKYHSKGKHIYALHKSIIDADVIVSIPKLKTHGKVGITCGLKGCVGAIGLKDCLAHYTQGSPKTNGDEFNSNSRLYDFWRSSLSRFHDRANRVKPCVVGNILRIADRNVRRAISRAGGILSGGWPGNDTAWRMTLDVARAIRFGTVNGDLSDTEQRKHILVTDGIIGGHRDGPLSPSPIHAGMLLFSDNVATGDFVNCLVMGFDPMKIPLVREAFNLSCFPITDHSYRDIEVVLNGSRTKPFDIPKQTISRFEPPSAWKRHIELDQ